MKCANLLIPIFIAITAVFGDYLVYRSIFSTSEILRAFSDTTVHAIIGFLSALAFFSLEFNLSNQVVLINVLLCTSISFLIDVDHFIVAKSFLLKDVTHTKQRGIFHCISFWLPVTLVLFGYSYFYKKIHVFLLNWMLILAFTSHLLRDGNRRGLWLYPFGHTPPINTYLYIVLSMILPYAFATIYKYFKTDFNKYTKLNYVMTV